MAVAGGPRGSAALLCFVLAALAWHPVVSFKAYDAGKEEMEMLKAQSKRTDAESKVENLPKNGRRLAATAVTPKTLSIGPVCEGEEVDVVCPSGTEISEILVGFYGREADTPACGLDTNLPTVTCLSADAPRLVLEACYGRPSCSLTASKTSFGGTTCASGLTTYARVQVLCSAPLPRIEVPLDGQALRVVRPPVRLRQLSQAGGDGWRTEEIGTWYRLMCPRSFVSAFKVFHVGLRDASKDIIDYAGITRIYLSCRTASGLDLPSVTTGVSLLDNTTVLPNSQYVMDGEDPVPLSSLAMNISQTLTCGAGHVAVSARQQVAPWSPQSRELLDDMGMTSLEMWCDDAKLLSPSDDYSSQDWFWSNVTACPKGWGVCGLDVNVQDTNYGFSDNMGITGARLVCCPAYEAVGCPQIDGFKFKPIINPTSPFPSATRSEEDMAADCLAAGCSCVGFSTADEQLGDWDEYESAVYVASNSSGCVGTYMREFKPHCSLPNPYQIKYGVSLKDLPGNSDWARYGDINKAKWYRVVCEPKSAVTSISVEYQAATFDVGADNTMFNKILNINCRSIFDGDSVIGAPIIPGAAFGDSTYEYPQCDPGYVAYAARIKVADVQQLTILSNENTTLDNTGVGDIQLRCTDGKVLSSDIADTAGTWRDWAECPRTTAICGFKTKVPTVWDKDKVAAIGLQLLCCPDTGFFPPPDPICDDANLQLSDDMMAQVCAPSNLPATSVPSGGCPFQLDITGGCGRGQVQVAEFLQDGAVVTSLEFWSTYSASEDDTDVSRAVVALRANFSNGQEVYIGDVDTAMNSPPSTKKVKVPFTAMRKMNVWKKRFTQDDGSTFSIVQSLDLWWKDGASMFDATTTRSGYPVTMPNEYTGIGSGRVFGVIATADDQFIYNIGFIFLKPIVNSVTDIVVPFLDQQLADQKAEPKSIVSNRFTNDADKEADFVCQGSSSESTESSVEWSSESTFGWEVARTASIGTEIGDEDVTGSVAIQLENTFAMRQSTTTGSGGSETRSETIEMSYGPMTNKVPPYAEGLCELTYFKTPITLKYVMYQTLDVKDGETTIQYRRIAPGTWTRVNVTSTTGVFSLRFNPSCKNKETDDTCDELVKINKCVTDATRMVGTKENPGICVRACNRCDLVVDCKGRAQAPATCAA